MRIFISNEYMHLLSKELTFISYAQIDGTMFKTAGSTVNVIPKRIMWGSTYAYGALFHIPNDFYLKKLDILHGCSLSVLLQNHPYDFNHRFITDVYPISFESLEDFEQLKWKTSKPVKAYFYALNPQNKRFKVYDHRNRRITDGVDKEAFIKLFNSMS